MRNFCFTLLFIGLPQIGCYDSQAQNSAIVRQVEAAGAGDISSYTLQGLVQWFSVRPQFALQISNQCRAVAMTAPANWLTSAEGTTCHAADISAPPPTYTAKGQVF
jgi:hypothetical protein